MQITACYFPKLITKKTLKANKKRSTAASTSAMKLTFENLVHSHKRRSLSSMSEFFSCHTYGMWLAFPTNLPVCTKANLPETPCFLTARLFPLYTCLAVILETTPLKRKRSGIKCCTLFIIVNATITTFHSRTQNHCLWSIPKTQLFIYFYFFIATMATGPQGYGCRQAKEKCT